MLDRILKLGKETAIYGLSSIVGRFLNFLLVPVTTNFLATADYGVQANIYAYIAFAFVVYGYGMDSAYMRFVVSLDTADKKQTVSVPYFSLLGTSVLFSLLIYLCAPAISGVLGVDAVHTDLIRYSGWILCFDTLAIVPFAYLRMENRAKMFAGLRILNIAINVLLTILLFVVLKMGVEAVFIANLLASAVTALVLAAIVFPQLTLRFPSGLYNEMIRFGLPYIPAGLAGIAIQVIDVPILKALTNDATVGVYRANYRLGVLMMLVVGMFDYAWRPFFLTHAKDNDAQKLFSKVFTYFVALMMLVFVTGSLFVDDIVRIRVLGRYIIHPDYWGGLGIVPIILLAYVFMGAYVNFVVGVYLEKKTKYLPYATGAGALVNVVVNFLLIPKFGITGAAVATLLSCVVMAVGIYFPSQRLYHVEYEWGRLTRLTLAACTVVVVFLMLGLQPASAVGIAVKLGFSAAFILLVFVLKVFDSADIKETRDALSKMFVRS
jgi:O-antigen/teichoic acid export membrane protein